ncbi:m-phase inducer phosphatase [Neonectria magnoliae]|uniref:M-phase inducer phosphatase n=1 Tax=Neonectria magnoliae TaxID=2732573 RepID=A0ABR1HYG8_9HYPO
MEASSPLAAMHRPMPVPGWGRDIFRSHSHNHFSGSSGGSSGFSLREQLHKSTADYFNVKDIRGSSPAASLAADLSQNFRLDSDASPHFPTPRRALFTSHTISGMEGRDCVTTPPIPSSSPAPLTELMEMSPLPHKMPFFSQIDITSPTPGSTPITDDEMMLDSPAPISRQSSLEPANPIVADECFESASPPQERRPSSANSPCAPIPLGLRARHGFPNFTGSGNYRTGSPMNCHARRQSNPFLRNRKQFRRSLSMFEHPADIMKTKSESPETASSALQSVMDVEESQEPVLPHFLTDDPTDTIPRITKETLVDVLDGKYYEHFDQKMVIDCRFEYEYDGGHIDGAVNYNDKELLTSQLFKTPMSGRTLLIFHCEYSAHRAPLMARHVRSEDRTVNAEYYPKLTYPEVYILDGGYSGFFVDHRCRCYPQEYVEMSDEKHQRTCEREMGRLKSRKGLNRAQTFAFGQRERCVDESPTAPSRPTSRQTPTMAFFGNYSPIVGERTHTRRMASY